MKIAFYDSNLTDAQWSLLEPMLPATERRRIVNAILYVIKVVSRGGCCRWTFRLYQTVFHIFRQWTLNHTWEALNARLRAHVREDGAGPIAGDHNRKPPGAPLQNWRNAGAGDLFPRRTRHSEPP